MSRSVESPLDCSTVVRALWDYLDRELNDGDMSAIDAHLAACENCRAHASFERQLIDQIRGLQVQYADPDALRARVIDMLRRERAAGANR